MLTAMKSDLFLMRSQLKALLVVFGFMLAMSYIQSSVFFVFFYAAFICVFTPFNLALFGEQSGWEAVLLSAPISRPAMVRARYAVCLVFLLVIMVISFAFANLIDPTPESIYIMLFFLPAILLLISVLQPLLYRFGVQKTRYLLMFLSILPAALMLLVSRANIGGQTSINALNVEEIGQFLMSAPFLAAINAMSLVLLCLSCVLSCFIYNKKEF